MGSNGGTLKGEWKMSKFKKVLRENNLFDLRIQRNPFTFSNCRAGTQEYRARLDGALACCSWKCNFSDAVVEHVATLTSDHFLLVIDFWAIIGLVKKGD